MATTVTVNSTYEGDVLREVYGAMFNENSAMKNGTVLMLPNIKYQQTIRLVDLANGRKDYTCGWAPQGSIVFAEKKLTPKKIMDQMDVCKEDFIRAWDVATMGPSAHNTQLPRDEAEAFIREKLAETSEFIGRSIWQGVESTDGDFGGFIEKFIASGTVIKPTGIGVDIDKTNVVAELEKVTTAIPNSIRGKVKVSISANVADAYAQSLINPQITNGLGGEALTMRYGNYTLFVDYGLPANTIVIAEPRNLMVGTQLVADSNEIKTRDQDDSTLDGTVRFKMVYSFGTQFARDEQIVYYNSNPS